MVEMDEEEFRENHRLSKRATQDIIDRYSQSRYANTTARGNAVSPSLEVYLTCFYLIYIYMGNFLINVWTESFKKGYMLMLRTLSLLGDAVFE